MSHHLFWVQELAAWFNISAALLTWTDVLLLVEMNSQQMYELLRGLVHPTTYVLQSYGSVFLFFFFLQFIYTQLLSFAIFCLLWLYSKKHESCFWKQITNLSRLIPNAFFSIDFSISLNSITFCKVMNNKY